MDKIYGLLYNNEKNDFLIKPLSEILDDNLTDAYQNLNDGYKLIYITSKEEDCKEKKIIFENEIKRQHDAMRNFHKLFEINKKEDN